LFRSPRENNGDMSLGHVVLEAFTLSYRFLLADITDEKPIQKGSAQTLFGIADRLRFCHFERTCRSAMFGDEHVDVVQLRVSSDDGQVATPDIFGDDGGDQTSKSRRGERLHQDWVCDCNATMAILTLYLKLLSL